MSESGEGSPTKPKVEGESFTKKREFGQLLPKDFGLVATSSEVLAEQQKTFRDRHLTYSEASERADKIMVDPENTRQRLETSSALASTSVEMETRALYDPLEAYREKSGLIEKRDRLMKSLFDSLSFERALDNFSRAAKIFSGKRYRDMAEINKDYPHLTRAEMTLLSLLDEVPRLYLTTGHSRNYQPKSEEEKGCYEVPMIAGASTDGLMFTDDLTNPNRMYAEDAHGHLGITGADEPFVEKVHFKKSIKKIIDDLVPLIISNYRLHERIWNTADSALVDGMGKLDRIAFERTLGHSPEVPLAQAIESLAPPEKEQFYERQRSIDARVGKNMIINLTTGELLQPKSVIKLFGLLHEIPSRLIEDERPFEGAFAAFGPGVLFMDAAGETVAYSPYSPYYLRDALQGFHVEAIDAGKTNPTVAMLFNQVAKRAEELTMTDAENRGEDPSTLEGIQIDMKLKYSIDLEILPQMRIAPTKMNDFSASRGAFTVLEPTSKFGVEEADQLLKIFNLLPPELINGIRRVKKVTRDIFPLQDMLSRNHLLGEFDLHNGALIIYQHPNLPLTAHTPETRALRAFTITHEVAHNMWQKLSKEEQNAWRAISWDTLGPTEPREDFLTMYSGTENEEEDFCDHVASFILHGPEFRMKAGEVPSLAEKYTQIKNLITRLTGRVIEYPKVSPNTIEEITGKIRDQVTILDEEIVAMERKLEKAEENITQQELKKISVELDKKPAPDVIPFGEKIDLSEEDTGDNDFDRIAALTEEINFKRNSILTLQGLFAESLSEKKALRLAQKIYTLIDKGWFDEAFKTGKKRVGPAERSYFEDLMQKIKVALETGNFPEV